MPPAAAQVLRRNPTEASCCRPLFACAGGGGAVVLQDPIQALGVEAEALKRVFNVSRRPRRCPC